MSKQGGLIHLSHYNDRDKEAGSNILWILVVDHHPQNIGGGGK